ncbi:protein translocase subunit SecF [Desulfosudis oleivorans]|uniref:Protein-export membrane protein SecF n=1 Tax=Desulfosudis oleivorans (strain DSM 6200 / JCM 39069 / Hxd3) TaxID=96561 RepID=A8ZW13_DESOH|nr:protein translocase subunit SecF [Desulfosudis oleivorans]ABW68247.1 protein-export membrane protein SecF [Desulfosudis oleivorans Hxd3]
MFEIIKDGTTIDFVGKQKYAFVFSAAMILITIISLVAHGGPRYGIDFAGGTLVQVKFASPVSTNTIASSLKTVGIDVSTVQAYGHPKEGDCQYLVNSAMDMTGISGDDFEDKVKTALAGATGQTAEITRVEMVGPTVGKSLRGKALMALFFSLLFINIYISGRFEMKWVVAGVVAGGLILAVWLFSMLGISIPYLILVALVVSLVLFWVLELKYAMGAIVALIHDVTITVGIFSITGKEFSLPIIAALLTIIGYSLNDTIIVFDRIRENLKKLSRKSLPDIINTSINETLSRTLLTSGTTLIVVAALFVFGGTIIHDFAFAMLVGIGVGTYSSIFVASPILLLWKKK